ncbi:hypothetical protein SCHPADRAFT_318173 [Schizopora paradoxa]|uniref:Uncharacterized protein n=1 Tax=Schizopora paradoxa TaxID=27342 RepID=A0A0H2RXT4_9AGAM|nr:hypothetical protein SCHPADRAFT_318173 [Schizopora paradoxa]
MDSYDCTVTSTISHPSFHPLLDELRRDDMTYSYASTWSSNYTVSNRPGPGRLLGNMYSRAGTSLERRLGKFINRGAMRKYEMAVAVLNEFGYFYDVFESKAIKEHEKACTILLICASDVVTFSWKHSSANYSLEWLYWFKLASRCLSSQCRLLALRNAFSKL